MTTLQALARNAGQIQNVVPGTDILEVSDLDYAGAMDIGETNATSINIGSVGVTTTVKGDLTVDGATTLTGASQMDGDVNLGDGTGDTITIGGGGDTIYYGTSGDTQTLRADLGVNNAVDIRMDRVTGAGVFVLPKASTGEAGAIRIDASNDLQWWNGASWATAGTSTGNTLQQAYDTGDGTITLDASGDFVVELDNATGDVFQVISSTGGADSLTLTSTGANAMSLAADVTTLSLDSTDTTNLTMTANDAGTKTLTIAATNGGAGVAALDVDADGAVTIDSGTTLGIGTAAAAQTITVGNSTGATAVNLQSGTAGINLNDGVGQFDMDGAGAISTSAVTTIDLDGSGAISINSSGGAINIGNDAVAQNILIGTAGARSVVALGNASAASTLVRGVAITETAEEDFNMNLSANDASARTMSITVSNIGVGTATLEIDVDETIEINSSAGTINLGNDAVAQAINIGTGAAARTITIGNVTGATAINANLGSAGMTWADSGGTLMTLDGTGLTAESGTNVNEFSIDGTLAGNSDDALPTEKAVKTYVDAQISASDSLQESYDVGQSITVAIAKGNLSFQVTDELSNGGGFEVTHDGGAGTWYWDESGDGPTLMDCIAALNLFQLDAKFNVGQNSATTSDQDYSTLDIATTSTLTIKGGGVSKYGDDTATLDFDGSGSLSETGMGNYSLTPSGTVTMQGGGVSKYGDDTATLDFDGSGAVTETGMTSLSLTPSGAITMTAGAPSAWAISSGALTLTSAAAATWSTAVGILTVKGDDGLALDANDGEITFDDAYRAGGTYSAAMPFADAQAEWDRFGCVHLLGRAAGRGRCNRCPRYGLQHRDERNPLRRRCQRCQQEVWPLRCCGGRCDHGEWRRCSGCQHGCREHHVQRFGDLERRRCGLPGYERR